MTKCKLHALFPRFFGIFTLEGRPGDFPKPMQAFVFLRPMAFSVTWSIEQTGRCGSSLNPEHRLRCSEAASPFP
jgi:hypothetical protein